MGLLDKFEQSLDKLVNGAFAKAFKSDVQPVEIAAALQKNMDERAAIVTRARTVVPNQFTVQLSPSDYSRLGDYSKALISELEGLVSAHADEQRYTFLGPVSVELEADDELETGMLRVRSQAIAGQMAAPIVPPAQKRTARRERRDTTAVAPPVKPPRPSVRARLLAAGQDIPLSAPVTLLGRGSEADIRLEDPGVSRRHAEIHLGDVPEIVDLNSTNGTVVDGRKVQRSVLSDGSVIRLGSTDITFRST